MDYINHLRELRLDQIRENGMGIRYKIVAIETSGYVICRKLNYFQDTCRIWCDFLESWKEVQGGELKLVS